MKEEQKKEVIMPTKVKNLIDGKEYSVSSYTEVDHVNPAFTGSIRILDEDGDIYTTLLLNQYETLTTTGNYAHMSVGM